MKIKQTKNNFNLALIQKEKTCLNVLETETSSIRQDREQKLENELKKLQKSYLQLLDSQDRYKKIYDCAPVGFLTLNNQGYIIDINNCACELIDFSNIQLLGTKLSRYILDEDKNDFVSFLKQLKVSNNKQKIMFRIHQSNTDISTVICQGCFSKVDKASDEFFLMLQDITEQKKVEQAIHQLNEQLKLKIHAQNAELFLKNEKLLDNIKEIKHSKQQVVIREAKLISIFNATAEAIITFNETGIIKSINEAVTTIFGYKTNELMGHNVSKLMPIQIGKHHNSNIAKYLVSHQAQVIGSTRQLEGLRKDGTLIPIDLSISEYRVNNKSYFIVIIRDVSDRKNKELQDKQHLDQLAHVTRMGLMGEMAAGIAHEVNQPLTAIATYCHVCLVMLKTGDFDQVLLEQTLIKTEKQACRAGQIITRMREFISAKTLHRSSVNIHDLIKNVIDLAADECQQYSVKYNLDLTDSLPLISVDEIQIEQVLLNLIKNSIEVLAKLPQQQQRKLSIQTYLTDDKQIEIRVKDNGYGISKEAQAKIFTPFFTTKPAGMGMGLSICQSLITAHGGQLRFNSNLRKGATFYFTLPAEETEL